MTKWNKDLTSNDLKSLFDANTILKADADNTPEALTVAEQRIIGRITSGEISALTGAQALLAMGISASAAELNHVDGVTSAIQTQIDSTFFHNGLADGGVIGAMLEAMDGLDKILDGGTF